MMDYLFIIKIIRQERLSQLYPIKNQLNYNTFRLVNTNIRYTAQYIQYKTLSISLPLSLLYYLISSILSIFISINILQGQIQLNFLRKLGVINLFLGCFDLNTILSQNKNSEFLFQFIFKNLRIIFGLFIGFILALLGTSLVFFELFNYHSLFGNLQESFTVVFSLMMQDNVLTIFDELDSFCGHFLVYFSILIFALTFLEILVSIISVGFQRSREEFERFKKEKQKELQEL